MPSRFVEPYQLYALDRDNHQAGITAPSGDLWSPSGTVTTVANQAFVVRFVPTRAMTALKIVYVVTTAAGSNDNVDVGIYSSGLTKLVSLGATAGQLNSTGIKTLTVASSALTAGTVYYAAFSVGAIGGTAAVVAGTGCGNAGVSNAYGTSNPQAEAALKGTSHPLPSSLSALTWGSLATYPLLAIRET